MTRPWKPLLFAVIGMVGIIAGTYAGSTYNHVLMMVIGAALVLYGVLIASGRAIVPSKGWLISLMVLSIVMTFVSVAQ